MYLLDPPQTPRVFCPFVAIRLRRKDDFSPEPAEVKADRLQFVGQVWRK
jgi:hypothetical protein